MAWSQEGMSGLGNLIGLGYGIYKQKEKEDKLNELLKGDGPITQKLYAASMADPSLLNDKSFQTKLEIATKMEELQSKQAVAQQAAQQASVQAGKQKLFEDMLNAGPVAGRAETIAEYGAGVVPKEQYTLAGDRLKAQEKAAVDIAAADVGYGREQEKATTLFGRQRVAAREDQAAQAAATQANTRLSSALSLKNQMTMADYNKAAELNKAGRPPLPGTESYNKGIGALNDAKNGLGAVDQYLDKIKKTGGLLPTVGRAASEIEALQLAAAVALAKANNPGRAPTDGDVEVAMRQLPDPSSFGTSQSNAVAKAKVVRDAMLNNYQQHEKLFGGYQGAERYQKAPPTGFKVKGK